MEAAATLVGEQIHFDCPTCQAPFARITALPSEGVPSFGASCESCGAALSIGSPLDVVRTTAASRTDSKAPSDSSQRTPRFCASCGGSVAGAERFCPACGASTAPGTSTADELKQRVVASSADAFAALRRLVANPVGGLAPVYEAMGARRAQAAGIALGVFFALSCAFGVALGAKHWTSGIFSFGLGQGFGSFLKLALAFLVLPAALTVIAFGTRQLLRAAQPVAADVFTCAAAVAPLGIAILLSGILGIANLEVIGLLLFFSTTYLLLILFAGITRIGGLAENVAAPALPVMLLLATWLAKIVFAALL